MSSKTAIIRAIGEGELELPRAIEEALAANDRVKLLLTALQAAEQHADHPWSAVLDLAAERRAAGLGPEIDAAMTASRREPGGALHVPGAGHLRTTLLESLAALLAPLELANSPQAAGLAARLASVQSALPQLAEDRVPAGLIAAMASTDPPGAGRGESVHRLTMDLHQALVALQREVAEESVDGARVWRITDDDRRLVGAFMAGVNDTAPLKFDHPGLGTTATRAAASLVIQNDIGATSAHVLVLHIEGLTATLRCTDVHRQRLEFLRAILRPFEVTWSETSPQPAEAAAVGTTFLIATARFTAADRRALERYLTFLGSRIVFLIDWNRARKALRGLLPKADVLRLLEWAAQEKIGHRGFLEIGGARMVSEAMQFAQPAPLHRGEPLHELLGIDGAFEFLQFVLREAAGGLRAGRDERFIHDEIKAELARRLRSVHAELLALALRHAERVFDLACGVRDGLIARAEPRAGPLLERTARRARGWEQENDTIVSRIRALAARTASPEAYAEVLHRADEAADGLEEAAFLMTHVGGVADADKPLAALETLASLLVEGAQESVKMFAAASHVTRAGASEDLQDFFAAVDRVVAVEHAADDAERSVTSALLAGPADARPFYLLGGLSRALEAAADGLALSALKLRDQLLNRIMTA